MTTFAQDIRHQPHLEPAVRPKPVDAAEYRSTTCPVCFGECQQRVRGLFCFRCRGWLVVELREGLQVYSLWQGRP